MADQALIDYQLKLQADGEELAEFHQDGLHEALIAGDEEKIRARLTLESSRVSGSYKNLAGGVWSKTQLHFKRKP